MKLVDLQDFDLFEKYRVQNLRKMTFVLKSQHQQRSQNHSIAYERLSKLFNQKTSQIVWAKYFPNFYHQASSYFILILTQQVIDKKERRIQIKRIYPYKDKTQNTKETTQVLQQLEITFITNEQQQFTQQNIIAANFIHQNALIVMNNPFQLYFVTKKSPKPIKILLEETQLTDVISSFSFETNDEEKKKQPFILTIYGQDKNAQTNKLITINLQTFEIKEITHSKDYSPKSRINHFHMFHDDRLYVFGGQSHKKSQIQELLWSFDLEKGYWFALQMPYRELCAKFDQYLSAVYDSGKIIVFIEGNFYLLEIYQCKITKITCEQSQDKLKKLFENEKIRGMLVFEKKLYFYSVNSIVSTSFTLQKK